MLTVSDLLKQAPDSYVEGGFQAVVRSTEPAQGKRPPKAILADSTGAATIKATLWGRPRLDVGHVYVFAGKGIKLSVYQGTNEVSIGDKATIDAVGASVHAPEQAQRAAAGAPSVNGTPQPVNGQTVGMAMKLATDLLIESGDSIALDTQAYWQHVHAVASHIIRVSRALEAGKLTPASWAKPDPAPAPQPVRQPAPKPQPGPDGSAFPVGQGADEDAF